MRNLLFVGLGNPGDQYNYTRHNIGFDILNSFMKNINKNFINKCNGEYYSIENDEYKFHFFKPMTYMNNSGIPVKNLIKNINIQSEKVFYNKEKNSEFVKDIFVFCDDLDLKLCDIKIKYGKGSHNGYKSLNENIQGLYHKINIGIDRPIDKNHVSNYVLSKFSPNEKLKVNSLANNISCNLVSLINNEINLINFFKNIIAK